MKKSSILFIHLVLWLIQFFVVFVIYDFIISQSILKDIFSKNFILWIALVVLTALMVPFYTYYFIWEGMFTGNRKKTWQLAGVLIFLIFPPIYIILDEGAITLSNYLKFAVIIGFFSLLGLLLRNFVNGVSATMEKNILKKKQLQYELGFLKSQINPHFLFNTLNNIDALIDKDPGTASRSLITLSDIMRYMVYESDGDTVRLSDEIKYIENVIELNRLRFKSGDNISFKIQGDIKNQKIAPMLLIPIIENAFKHSRKKPPTKEIDIVIAVSDDRLILTCSNTYDSSPENGSHSGIGLQTLKKRLNLLYADNYKLEIQQLPSTFNVELNIPLVE